MVLELECNTALAQQPLRGSYPLHTPVSSILGWWPTLEPHRICSSRASSEA